jgi:hypothetical protein
MKEIPVCRLLQLLLQQEHYRKKIARFIQIEGARTVFDPGFVTQNSFDSALQAFIETGCRYEKNILFGFCFELVTHILAYIQLSS